MNKSVSPENCFSRGKAEADKGIPKNERVELAHVMSWMLGCTEYGLLSSKGVEIGYYDRLSDKYCSYLRQNFPKDDTKKLPSNS